MKPEVKAKLEQKEQSTFHHDMLTSTKKLVEMSRSEMSKYYSTWDQHDDVYRGKRAPDKEDEASSKADEPVKMIVPLSFAQIQTFVSFCFLLYTQNQKFFELVPSGDEDFKIRDACQDVLARDLRKNKWPGILYQCLLDTGRFGLGVIETNWVEHYQYVSVKKQGEPVMFQGMEIAPGEVTEEVQKVLRYQGNELNSVSPYRWFPDTRLPLSKFQKGEFCASEEEYSRVQLEQMEADGEVAGIDHVEAFSQEQLDRRKSNSRMTFVSGGEAPGGGSRGRSGTVDDMSVESTILVTKCQRRLVPSKFMLDGDKPLGPEKYPVLYTIWYANDKRVIRCEPSETLHNQFNYDLTEFTPDMHNVVNGGLCEVIDRLQSVITWFINSHITAVRRTIDNRIVVDPAGVDMRSLEARSSVILLKKGASKTGVDRWVKQLQVVDTTGAHMNDADVLGKLLQVITGVNDNAMGQYNSGRRSATESRAVTAGAAGRLKTCATVMWANGFDPLGQKMLTNLRQGLEFESFQRIIGKPKDDDQLGWQALVEQFEAFKSTIEDLIGGDDFMVFDSTLPSEKGFIAQSLQELASVIMSNPDAAMMLDIDPKPMLEEIQSLRGVTNLTRFSLRKRLMEEQAKAAQQGQLPPPVTQPGQPQPPQPAQPPSV